MKALIMAGGKGTRLTEITKNLLPKPMVELNEKKLLEYAIDNLIEYGVDEIFLSIGFMHEVIEEYFSKKQYPAKIHFIVEDEPLGSGGALYLIKNQLDDDFVVCNGDALFNINIKKMLDFHKSKNSIATLLTHPNYHPYDSDLIICDESDKVLKIDKSLFDDEVIKIVIPGEIGELCILPHHIYFQHGNISGGLPVLSSHKVHRNSQDMNLPLTLQI